MKLDPRRENLTGLVRAASGGRRAPEAPAASTAAPLQLLAHQGDERLDVATAESVVCRPDRVDCHRVECTRPASSSRRLTWSIVVVGALLLLLLLYAMLLLALVIAGRRESARALAGMLVGSGDGTLAGPALAGSLRWTLFKQPGELVWAMSPTLQIETNDGALIRADGRGFAAREAVEARDWRVAAALRFRTDDTRYAWLDGALGLRAGDFDSERHVLERGRRTDTGHRLHQDGAGASSNNRHRHRGL